MLMIWVVGNRRARLDAVRKQIWSLETSYLVTVICSKEDLAQARNEIKPDLVVLESNPRFEMPAWEAPLMSFTGDICEGEIAALTQPAFV